MDAQTATQNTTRLIVIVVALALLFGGAAGATAGWIAGSNSAAGPPGADGAAGIDGQDGAPGNDGADGSPGLDGAPGKDGAPGPAGPRGLTGAPGTPGSQGPAGPAGPQGIPGPQGPPGADGQDGAPGAPGTPGTPGQDGAPGAPGTDGTNGDDAAPWVLLSADDVPVSSFDIWGGVAVHSGDADLVTIVSATGFSAVQLAPGTYRVTFLAIASADEPFSGEVQVVPTTFGLLEFGTEFQSLALSYSTINTSAIWDAPTGGEFIIGGYLGSGDTDATIGNVYIHIQQLD